MTLESGDRKINKWIVLLIMGVCCVCAVKELFVGFTADEEYQLVLAYRFVNGDRLLAESWDTLQTSAFFAQFLIWIFIKIFHTTTGSLLFLRVCGIAMQAAVSVFLYSTLKKHINKSGAFLVSAAFFCTFTKLVATPEFSNMQTWCLVTAVCIIWRAQELYEAAENRKADVLIVVSALLYCVTVLASACVIIVPVFAVFMARLCKKGGVRRNLLFLGTCAVTGAVYLGLIVGINGLDLTLFGIDGMINGDKTHLSSNLLNGSTKAEEYLRNFGTIGLWLAVTLVLAVAVSLAVRVLRKEKNDLWMPVWIFEGFAITLYNWVIRKAGYEGLKLYIPVMVIVGIAVFFGLKKKGTGDEMSVPFYAILVGIAAFVNVLLISNVGVIGNLTFLNTSALWALVILIKKAETAGLEKQAAPILVTFFAVMAFGTAFTLNAGPIGSTVFDIDRSGLLREGPAIGTFVSKDVEYIQDNSTRLFKSMVKENSSVLIVTNFFRNQSLTTLYMLEGVNISHYTVNSTPTYGNALYDYWKRFPDKDPGVIIVNLDSCTYQDYLWAEELIGDKDGWVQASFENVFFYVRPECVKEEYLANLTNQ